jgi:hypothetical protein
MWDKMELLSKALHYWPLKYPHDQVAPSGWLAAPADHRMKNNREKDPGSCPDDFLMRQPFVKVHDISRPTET